MLSLAVSVMAQLHAVVYGFVRIRLCESRRRVLNYVTMEDMSSNRFLSFFRRASP